MTDTTASRHSLTLGEAMLFAAMASLLAAIGHGLFVVLRVYGMHKFSWASRDILWTGTLSYALYIVPITLLVWIVTRALKVRSQATATITAALSMAGLGVLLLSRTIHPLALFLLSLGVALRIASWVQHDLAVRTRLARRVTVVLTLGVVVASGIIRGLPLARQSRVLSSAPVATTERPNVLFIILDTVRAASMGMYGYSVPNTPNIERLAAEGTRFNWAFSPSSWTLPSHSSMFTGLTARDVGAGWRRSLAGSRYTIAEHLTARGFVSAGFVANKSFTTWETGVNQGFQRWDDIGISPAETFWTSSFSQTPLVRDLMSADSVVRWTSALKRFDLRLASESRHARRHAADVVDHFLDWQTNVGEHRFFAFLNFIDAHDPYDAPPPWDTKFVSNPKGRDHYDASIAYMDHEIGRLIDQLKARGELDRTVIILGSDHGELFGEHSLSLHGRFLYLNSIHVPLVMRFPGKVPAGQVITAPVSLDRIPATILDILGDTTSAFPGVSLRATWNGAVHNEPVSTAESWVERYPWGGKGSKDPASRGAVASVSDSVWHWLHTEGDTNDELYRYREDAVEATDHAAKPENVAVRDTLRAAAERRKLLR